MKKTGQYEKAIELNNKALDIIKTQMGSDSIDIAICLGNIGDNYLDMGNYAKAVGYLEKSNDINQRRLGLGNPATVTIMTLLAETYIELDDYKKAISLLNETLKAAKLMFGEQNHTIGRVLFDLGVAYRQIDDLTNAKNYLEKSLSIFLNLHGINDINVANALNSLGETYSLMGDNPRAIECEEQALDIQKKLLGAESNNVGTTLTTIGITYINNKEYNKAIPVLQNALSIKKKIYGTNYRDIVDIYLWLSQAYLENNDYLNAQINVSNMIDSVDSLLVPMMNLGESQRLVWASRNLWFSLAAETLTAEKVDIIIFRWKGVVLDSLVNDKQISSILGATLEGKAKLERIRVLKNEITQQALSSGQINLSKQQEIDRLESSTDLPLIKTKDFVKASNVLSQLDSVLNSNDVVIDLVECYNYKDKSRRYGASIISKNSEPKFYPIEQASEIDNAVKASRDAICNGDEAALKYNYRFLSEKLWKPIASAIPSDTKKIYIGAEGPLNFLSFASLQDDQGKFIIEKYQVAYVGSGRDLLRPTKSVDKKSFVIYANPVFASDDTAKVTPGNTNLPASLGMRAVELAEFAKVQLPQLPGTELEAATVSRIAIDAQWTKETHLGADASKKGLMAMKAPAVLHLATHGFFLGGEEVGGEGKRGMKLAAVPDTSHAGEAVRNQAKPFKGISPMRQSGVALTGGQSTLQAWGRGEFPDPSNDGILTAEEVAGLDLNGTWLVTLSACDTGIGRVRSGEGVFGLRRAFMIAGAQNLLMTLWPVSDETTPKIMADFYKEALKTGDAAGSLAKVQRDWLVKLRQEKGLLAAIRDAGPFAMVVMSNPNAQKKETLDEELMLIHNRLEELNEQ